MEIRPATSADVRAIAEVHVASWNDAYRGIVPDDSIAERDVDRRTEQWNELVGTQIVLVADQQGAIAGCAAADRSTGTIGAIYIAPEHVRAGIGTQLLDAAHQQLRAAGRTHANLWVFSANATARAFYAARGYEPDGTTEVKHGQPTLRLSTALYAPPMAESRESTTRGFDVDENAVRFSNYLHVLRELVHLSCGHLPLEPRFEVKSLIGDHLHDDARAVTKIRRRLYELRTPSDYPGAPSEQLAALLDRANAAATTQEYLEIAYGELKPTLIAAVRTHLARLDPLIDEPSLRLLTQLLHRQERHTAELPAAAARTAFDDLGALPVRLRETRELKVMPPFDRPARDDFIEVTGEGDPHLTEALDINGEENHVPTESEEQKHFFHGLMNAELCAAELMARNSHEHPDMPWDFHVDMARQTWDEIRHAEIHDRLMAEELGCHWGDYPVGFGYLRSIYALDLLGRLALYNGTSEQKAMWRQSHRRNVLIELGQENVARVFDYLLADEVPHVHNGVRWGTHLLGGDENAYREKVRELRAGLDRTGTAASS